MEMDKRKLSCIVDENVFNCRLVPLLQDIIIVNLVINFWKEADFENTMHRYLQNYISINDNFGHMKHKISEKISLLPLPSLLKLKVTNFVRTIGVQIFQWIGYNGDSFSFHANPKSYLQSLPWTIEGTIDEKKAVELEIRNNTARYNDEDTFIKACGYCLEDDIINLWRCSSDEFKEDISDIFISSNYLVLYWVLHVKNELPELLSELDLINYNNMYNSNHSVYKNMVTFSVSECNTVAVKYFWHKLTEEEVNSYIVSWVEQVVEKIKYRKKHLERKYQESDKYTDTLCFLLSKINDKGQRVEILKKHYDVILENLFYYWPWQKFVLPIIQVMWDYIDERVYNALLSTIANEIKKGRNTEQLLVELWYHSPLNFKKCFIQHSINDLGGRILLWKLLEIEDLESVKLIINAADVEEKRQILFALIGDEQLKSLIYEDKLVLLDKLIEDNLPLECDIRNFKKKIVMKHGNSLLHNWICDDNWQKVEKFCVWSLMSQDKIDKFKQKRLNKVEIVKILYCKGKNDLINKFMNWCFNSEEEINQFKKENCIWMWNWDLQDF